MTDLMMRDVRLAGKRTVQTGDDAGGQSAFESERITDGKNPLTHKQIGGTAKGDRKEQFGRGVDFQHSDVGGGIDADDLRRIVAAVEQSNLNLLGAVDDVEIRKDVSLPVDYRTAAFAFGSYSEK